MSLMLFTHYLFGYAGTVVCSIGLALALCSVYIFTRRQMRSAVATYLTGLSISDSCLLSLGLVIAINSSIPPNQQSELFYSSHIHKHIFPYVYPCIIWFQFTSVWITIGFAIDRWFAIKWPMLHYTYSSKRACYIVLMIYGLGLLYSLPRFFEYKTEVQREQLSIIENLTEYVDHLVVTNKVLENRLYHYIVHLILYSLFQSILPLLLLSYFNVELIRSINASSNFLKRFTSLYMQSTRVGRETNPPRYREGTITRSVICLIGLFTLCQVPASILHYIYMFYRNHPILYICYDISNFLIFVNSAVNFFIFTYFNRKFRRELARVCFHSKKHRNLNLYSPSHHSFRRTNSYIRTFQQNSQNFHQCDVSQTNSWEYQKSNSRYLLRIDNETNNEHINNLRKKNSDASIQSQYHLHPFYQRSESLANLDASNTNTNLNINPIQRQERYSICDFNCKNLKNFSYSNNSKNLQLTSMYPRRHSERLSLKASPKHLYYITYKRKSTGQTSINNNNQIKRSSSSTITTNTPVSENSVSFNQNKLVKPIKNSTEKLEHCF